jgi:hypothetical protein
MKRALLGLLAAAALAGCGGAKELKPPSTLPVVVLSTPTAGAWVRLLRSGGWSVRTGTLDDIEKRTGAVVPADAALSNDQVDTLVKWVGKGGRIATAHTALLDKLGFDREASRRLKSIQGARWGRTLDVAPFTGDELTPLARPMVMAERRRGAGLVFGLAFDPVIVGQGWEFLPTAPALIGRDLGAPVGPRVQSAEVFVDPGGLHDGVKDAPAKIADLLARAGTRVAHVAGWNYDFTDPKNNYDYDALIAALHARGILAYAWLEPPFVTLRLWQDHPECRERTYTGREAQVDWRSLIQLYNPPCMALAQESWRRVLTRHDWDGVNIAELYFEPFVPQYEFNFTPFSDYAIQLFGKDPRKNLPAFYEWRKRTVTQLNEQVLRYVNGLPGAEHFGMMLTVIDDKLDPELGHQVGSDVRALARIATNAGASLMVEDPFTLWKRGPLRYDKLGPHVRSLMPPQAAIVDVNVVQRKFAHPTSQMQGAELGLALGSATAALGKLGVYALGTLTADDLDLLPRAMAASTSTTDLGVFGKWTVTVTAPAKGMHRLRVDGHQWPTANGVAVVPAGNHVLEWATGDPIGPGLVALGAELGTARVTAQTITFTYVARPDALAVVTERPTALQIDGKAAELDVVANPKGGYVVRVPTGTHSAELRF